MARSFLIIATFPPVRNAKIVYQFSLQINPSLFDSALSMKMFQKNQKQSIVIQPIRREEPRNTILYLLLYPFFNCGHLMPLKNNDVKILCQAKSLKPNWRVLGLQLGKTVLIYAK